MHKRSIRFSILLIILTLFVGFGVSFVAPKPVRADALGDFISQLTLGDFIRNLFQGLFGGTRGADNPYPTATPTPRPWLPTATPTRPIGPITATPETCPYANADTCEGVCGFNNCTSDGCTAGRFKCRTNPCPYANADTCEGVCGINNCTSCPGNRYKCSGPTATPTTRPNNCAQSCSNGVVRYCTACSNLTCTQWSTYNCPAGSCQNATQCSGNPTATVTPRPTNTPRPLPPTSTPVPGGPTSTPAPTYTPVPLPPVPTDSPAPPNPTATPTTPVGAACYYNVRLVNANGAVEPSALQTGTTEAGGCRTQGVRELVPTFYTQPSTAINISGWPCTDATYVGQSCTQGIVTGQFICLGGPLHEIKGCYNRSSGAYQRVSITSISPTPPAGATATPTSPPGSTATPTQIVATPTPAYTSFSACFTVFRSYIDGPTGGMSVSLTQLEDWRNNIPLPTPTRP